MQCFDGEFRLYDTEKLDRQCGIVPIGLVDGHVRALSFTVSPNTELSVCLYTILTFYLIQMAKEASLLQEGP